MKLRTIKEINSRITEIWEEKTEDLVLEYSKVNELLGNMQDLIKSIRINELKWMLGEKLE